MNHLAHYLLAPRTDAARMGTLLGDFARGADLSAWPAQVESAIRLHRRVDSVTDTHPLVADIKQYAPAELRRYAGILLDVFFDHVLTRQWTRWSDEPLEQFASAVYAGLARSASAMPPPARNLALRMGEFDILHNCATRAGVVHVLKRIAGRLSRPVALDAGIVMLDEHYAEIEQSFERFFPELQGIAAGWGEPPT